jgi:hypothetical protein
MEHSLDQLSPTGEKLLDNEDGDDLDSLDGLEEVPDVDFTTVEEHSIIKKLDVRVVGLVAGLYLLSFLDRSSMSITQSYDCAVNNQCVDIGNAKIAGLMTDLDLTSDQYEWFLTAFYITYISFQFMALL